MMKPLVTVIIRAYNIADIVGRAIDSVLAQKTNFPYLILIGEDASPSDNTREICEQYAQLYPEKVRLMPKAPNKGFVKNHYECLMACESEFVAYCDGDDYWVNEHKLQIQIDFLRANTDYVLTHGEMKLLDGITGVITVPEVRKNVPQGDVHKNVFTRHIANTSTVVFRRSALTDVNLNDWLMAGFGVDDIALWVYIAQKGKFHFDPTFDVVYLKGAESVCHSLQLTKRVKYMADTYNILYYMWDLFKPNFDRKYIDQLYQFDWATMLLSSRQIQSVVDVIRKVGLKMTIKTLVAGLKGETIVVRNKICKQITGE